MSSKDRKNTGEERKNRLAAELRANLKRRKAKTKDAVTTQITKANEDGHR